MNYSLRLVRTEAFRHKDKHVDALDDSFIRSHGASVRYFIPTLGLLRVRFFCTCALACFRDSAFTEAHRVLVFPDGLFILARHFVVAHARYVCRMDWP